MNLLYICLFIVLALQIEFYPLLVYLIRKVKVCGIPFLPMIFYGLALYLIIVHYLPGVEDKPFRPLVAYGCVFATFPLHLFMNLVVIRWIAKRVGSEA